MSKDGWREVNTVWRGGLVFEGMNPTGKEVRMGIDAGFSPMELLLAGLAGCTGIDVVDILRKKRQEPQAFEIQVRGRRADDHPRVYTRIEVTYLLWGENLTDSGVEHAIQLSESKYCSATAMLGAVAELKSRYRILQPGEDAGDAETFPE